MMRFRWIGVLALLAGCGEPTQQAGTATGPAADTDAAVELVARARFFGNPERSQGRFSPDGAWLSWLAPRDGVMNIWVAPVADPAAAHPVTQETGRGIRQHFWSHDSERLLYPQDQGGNENYHLYSVSRAGGQVIDLTPVPDGARAVLFRTSRERPEVALVGLNDRDPQLFDVYEINIITGARKLVLENPGYNRITADHTLKPRLARRTLPDGSAQLLRLDDGGSVVLAEYSAEDAMNSSVVGFDAANERAYLIDSRERDIAALVLLTLASGELEVVAQPERADIQSLLTDPVSHEVIAFSSEYDRAEWQGLNEVGRQIVRTVGQAVAGDVEFVSATADGRHFLLAADSATRSTVYFHYDHETGRVQELFVTRPELAGAPLQEMHPIVAAARDGLSLVSYLTLPPASDADGDGRPDAPQPMVLLVHGGPWARDDYGYHTLHQWLANRGYAVLSVNYRGSAGYGKQFLSAAVGQFAGRMHDDLIDMVNWSIEQKVARPDQVAIMGGSYGGYATLVGLTFTPDSFACGVDIVGPSNLITLIESFPAYWGPNLATTWYRFVGDPTDEQDRADMYNRSPIAKVANIRVPLLIGQGENDPRVTKLESDQIVAAMRERNLPVTYLNYPDEGHGFARPENNLSFFAVTEAFLSQCLGGRFEPVGDDFEGSSVQILHGAEFIPGLPEDA